MVTIKINERQGSRTLAIVDALSEAIDTGELRGGDRLPTHRALAEQLGVSLGTVTRAYAEAERRGLVVGEVGRGTFVRHRASGRNVVSHPYLKPDAEFDLSLNFPVRVPDLEREILQRQLAAVGGDHGVADEFSKLRAGGGGRHGDVGAEWIRPAIADINSSNVLLGTGSATSLTAALRTLTKPGDLLATESLTHMPVPSIADQCGLRVRTVPMDDYGILPEALDDLCRCEPVRVIYCQPTVHSATTATMPAERRRAIAHLLEEHNVMLIEDDDHFPLMSDPLPAIASFAPQRVIFVADVSRALAIGLRLSYVAAPEHLRTKLAEHILQTVWMISPLLSELTSCIIESGDGDRLIAAKRQEAEARQIMARQWFGRLLKPRPNEIGHHVWLSLPNGWSSQAFAAAALSREVAVTPPELFTIGQGLAPNAVRICIGAAKDRNALQEAISRLRGLLDHPPAGATTMF